MRSIVDARRRWKALFDAYNSADSCKRDTVKKGPRSPCVIGLRSICWRLFLSPSPLQSSTWISMLRSERNAYAELKRQYFQFGRDEDLMASDLHPLVDDASNPWDLLRRDEELRQEILQDVERCMPENAFFRNPGIQSMLHDILFVYCKLNQDLSYRQGLHEICAVVLWVVSCDAIAPSYTPQNKEDDDTIMLEALDSSELSIEADSFFIFQCIMRPVKAWYELGEDDRATSGKSEMKGNSPIIQKSRYIQELLNATDPELSCHLKNLDIFPQIFLIRWIRLLFGREFLLDELTEVWDLIFAAGDQELHLVDLVCVAMLLRVRWQLLECDYSSSLTLLLRYKYPDSRRDPPRAFVEDAIYLRDNLSSSGGAAIIFKYSERYPSPFEFESPSRSAPILPSPSKATALASFSPPLHRTTSFPESLHQKKIQKLSSSARPRIPLAQSSFSWMLGDDPATMSKSGYIRSTVSGTGGRKQSPSIYGGSDDGKCNGTVDGTDLFNSKDTDECFTLGNI